MVDRVVEEPRDFADHQKGYLDSRWVQRLLLAQATLQDLLTVATGEAAEQTGYRASVTIRTRPRSYTAASSDELGLRLDTVQYRDGAGPCLYAAEKGIPIVIADMGADSRWPRFSRHAAAAGMWSSLSQPLLSRGLPVGALNLYSADIGEASRRTRTLAAEHAERMAGLVVLTAHGYDDDNLVADLRATLITRSAVDQALGILIGQERCSATAAFAMLRTTADNTGTTLRDAAAAVIWQAAALTDNPN